MNVPMEFLRGVLGLLGLACAYMTGRTFAAVRKGWHKPSRLYGWIIRTVLCLGAVAFSLALWGTSREKEPEDLTHTIFPDEP